MTEYLILNDNYKYQEFDLDVLELAAFAPDAKDMMEILNFSFHNTIFSNQWSRPEATFTPIDGYPDAKIPDICRWTGATLILSPRAHVALKDLLQPFGELLPAVYGEEIYHIFNCLTEVEVDQSESQRVMQGEDIMEIKKISFDQLSVGDKTCFKTRFNLCLDIFCTDALKKAVEDSSLTGVIFTEDLTQSGY